MPLSQILLRPAWISILLLFACAVQTCAAPPVQGGAAACGPSSRLHAVLAAELAQGRPPEASPVGTCVANSARQGNVPAAMLLADIYQQGMVAAAAPGGSTALQLDLFGRQVAWLHLAAARGDPSAQLRLAQDTDGAAYRPMPSTALAWYQAAAENGSRPALAAIVSAYAQRRISEGQLYDLKKWLVARNDPAPIYRRMVRLLADPATPVLPR